MNGPPDWEWDLLKEMLDALGDDDIVEREEGDADGDLHKYDGITD